MSGRMLGQGLWFGFLAGFLLADAQGHIQGHQPVRDVPRNGGGIPAYLPKLEAAHNLDVTPMKTKQKQPFYKMRLRLHKRDLEEVPAEKRRYTPPLESLKADLAQTLQNEPDEMMIIKKRVVMPAFWKLMEEIKSNNEKRVVMPAFWKLMEEIKSNTKDENGLHVMKRIFMPTIWKMMEQMRRESMDEEGRIIKDVFTPAVLKLMKQVQKDTKGGSEINVSKRRWTLPLYWKKLKEMRLKKQEQQNLEENIQGQDYIDLITEKRAYMPPIHVFWNMMQSINPKNIEDLPNAQKRMYLPALLKELNNIKKKEAEKLQAQLQFLKAQGLKLMNPEDDFTADTETESGANSEIGNK